MNPTRLPKARRDLQYMRNRYQGRRPAAETLLNEFDVLLDDAEIEISKVISEKGHDIDMHYQGRLKQAEKREDDARNLAEVIRKEVTELRAARERRQALREERIREGDDVKVTIERGDQWSVAAIEDIAYRLRLGGATDETEVHLSTTRVAAYVPDPNMVRLGLEVEEAEASPKSRPTVAELWHRWRWTAAGWFATLSAGGLFGFLAR